MSSVFFAPWRHPIMQPPQPSHVVRSGPSPPKKVGIGNGDTPLNSLGCLEDRDVSAVKRIADSDRLSDFAKQLVRRTKNPVLGDAQHSRRRVVMLGHLRPPIVESFP